MSSISFTITIFCMLCTIPLPIFASRLSHKNILQTYIDTNDRGLICDIEPKDYSPNSCSFNHNNRHARVLMQRRVKCLMESSIPEARLNYPSFALVFSDRSDSQVYTRTVRNVGQPDSSYDVEISPPRGVDVVVEPTKLKFSEVNQTIEYKVTFRRLTSSPKKAVVRGFLKWKSNNYSVKNPIAVILS